MREGRREVCEGGKEGGREGGKEEGREEESKRREGGRKGGSMCATNIKRQGRSRWSLAVLQGGTQGLSLYLVHFFVFERSSILSIVVSCSLVSG